MTLGELVLRDVERLHPARGELGQDRLELLLADLVRGRERGGGAGECGGGRRGRGGEVEGEEDEGARVGGVAVDEFGNGAGVDDGVESEEPEVDGRASVRGKYKSWEGGEGRTLRVFRG